VNPIVIKLQREKKGAMQGKAYGENNGGVAITTKRNLGRKNQGEELP